MKKLKVALTLLLVFCCSLGLFACKNDEKEENKGPKGISEIEISGQKTNFKEDEEFSVGDLKVTVYYQNDDDAHELTAEEYEVDSKAYDKTQAGQYTIYVVPLNQPEELWDGKPESKDNRVKKSYTVSVDHSWKESTDGKYQFACDCGAKRNSFTGLEDKVKTVAWDQQATFEKGPEGKTYSGAKAPITGENHVSYGSLVAGQSLTLTMQINGITRAGELKYDEVNQKFTGIENWDTPLMGFRNGALGAIPREDFWVIGAAKGFTVPEGSNIPVKGDRAPTGTATPESTLWEFYVEGEEIHANDDFVNQDQTKWSTVVVQYDYQADGVMKITHICKRFDDQELKLTYSVNLPKAAYEIVVYGEYCDYTVTGIEFVAGLALDKYEVTKQPTNLVQPAGKMFDTTGLQTKATFSNGSTIENNFAAYAYRGEGEAQTRVNLATEPLTADLHDFFVEFNGAEVKLATITVVPTVVTGANSTAIKSGEETFESPELTYDYAVTADGKGIRLTMNGAAVKATTKQATVLGDGCTHFVAFKLLTNLAADAFDKVTTEGGENVKVIAEKADTTVDVIVGLKAGFKAFTLKLSKTVEEADTAVGSVLIDLSTLNQQLSAVAAEITETNFTLDEGGTYTVAYTGLTDVDNLYLVAGSARDKISDVKAKITDTYTEGHVPTSREGYYRVSNSLYIVKLEKTENSATVTYWLKAPDLGNLTSDQTFTTVSLRNGTSEADTLISVRLTYNLTVSNNITNIGTTDAPVYVKVAGNKLQVFIIKETENIVDGVQFAASLNIEHTPAEGEVYQMAYNVGVSLTKGAAAWLDQNELTMNTSAPKLIAFGTVNNPLDYDKGVVLVANLHLPAIGVRASSNSDKFRFTANEETENGQETYDLYTVGGGTESDKIVKSTLNKGEKLEILQQGSCVADDIRAYKTSDGFYYGARIVPATGAHEWKAEVNNVAECNKCGATKTKVVDGNSTYEYTILAESNMTALTNPATKSEWWNADFKFGTQQLGEGNFAVRYIWEQVTDPNYASNGAIVLASVAEGKGDIRKRFLEPATDQNWGQALKESGLLTLDSENSADDSVITYKITHVGHETETVTWSNEFAGQTGAWGGKYEVTAVRLGTTLYVYEKVTTEKESYTSELVITKFSTEALTVCLWGNSVFVENPKVNVGTVASTEKYGTEYENRQYLSGLEQGQEPEAGKFYTWRDWVELPNLMFGHEITVTGTLKGGNDTYKSVLWEMKQGITGRMDNWCWSFGENLFGYTKEGEADPNAGTNDSSWCTPTVTPTSEDWLADFKTIYTDCDWSINFSWKQKHQVIVTVKLWNEEKTYTDVYTLGIKGTAPESGLGVHLCAEQCTVSFKTITVD